MQSRTSLFFRDAVIEINWRHKSMFWQAVAHSHPYLSCPNLHTPFGVREQPPPLPTVCVCRKRTFAGTQFEQHHSTAESQPCNQACV